MNLGNVTVVTEVTLKFGCCQLQVTGARELGLSVAKR